MKKYLKTNFFIRKGKIFVYPHLDDSRHSHVSLIALFFIFIILFVMSLSLQPTEVTGHLVTIGSQNGMRPFFDLIDLLTAPVR